MKRQFSTFRFAFARRTVLAATAAFALTSTHSFADVVNISYATGAEVPLNAENFDPTGKILNVALNFAPSKDKDLTLIRNSAPGLIRGRFSNLVQRQIVTLHYRGAGYQFVANYYGGNGRDLVLMPINLDDLVPSAVQKLDNELVLALKKSRGQAPFDRTTSLRPEDYERDGRVLVDVHGAISNQLLNQITAAGAEVVAGTQTATALRAWVPFDRLEALASLPAIQTIAAARPSITRGIAPRQ